jgi:RNA recognition motif-containing protein
MSTIIPVKPLTAILENITGIKRSQRFRFKKRGTKMNIFIGNLSYNVTEGDLRQAFEAFGQVASATVIKDKLSGRSKGFGFVEMPEQAEAQSAIEVLNGKALKGRTITVNEARAHADNRRGRDRGVEGDRRGGGHRRGRGRY